MKTRTIPRTNLNAAVLFLGTAGFDSALDDLVSVAILDRYLKAGGNGLDTAEVYAEWDK